jgi:transposase-like protein
MTVVIPTTSVRHRNVPETRPPKQHQRRLEADELNRLVADYMSGVDVVELATRYGIARQTVFDHMRRQGAPRRHPRLTPDDVRKAVGMYQVGKSLAAIGRAVGVDPGTVHRALIKVGVQIRDCHGRERDLS